MNNLDSDRVNDPSMPRPEQPIPTPAQPEEPVPQPPQPEIPGHRPEDDPKLPPPDPDPPPTPIPGPTDPAVPRPISRLRQGYGGLRPMLRQGYGGLRPRLRQRYGGGDKKVGTHPQLRRAGHHAWVRRQESHVRSV